MASAGRLRSTGIEGMTQSDAVESSGIDFSTTLAPAYTVGWQGSLVCSGAETGPILRRAHQVAPTRTPSITKIVIPDQNEDERWKYDTIASDVSNGTEARERVVPTKEIEAPSKP